MAIQTKEFTCVQCPCGCNLTVTLEDGVVTDVSGNTCPRGAVYGEKEATCPERVVTSLVNIQDDWHPISVKTTQAVPREAVPAVVMDIRGTTVEGPVRAGDIVIKNVAGTGIDVVATSSHI